jgi:putative transposase
MGYVSFTWDGRVWVATTWGETVTLQPEFGPSIAMPMTQVEQLMQAGRLVVFKASDPDPTSVEVRRMLSHASPPSFERANGRYQALLAWQRGDPVTVSRKTLARWQERFTVADEQYGCGYVGLLTQESQRGPRAPLSDPASIALVDEAITRWYATPTAPTQKSVYVRYLQLCEERGIEPVSDRTLYRAIKARAGAELTTARKGRRAGYQEQPFYWHLDQTTPRHGERPWAIAHVDHTELDIELVSSVTSKPLGRPWATFLVDAYSRRLLAAYVTLDPPSYRSCLMVIRQCVQRFERLPQDLVVDGGKDFQSVYFETLLSRYGVTRKNRPGSRPRFGSVIERLFGTTTTQFINTLAGNTQATKIPRQVTNEVNPKERAVWTLAAFAEALKTWAFTVYDESLHPNLQACPREIYDMGMNLSGERLHKRIAYDQDFLMMTRPSTHTGTAKVQRGTGVTIKYLQYWNDAFKLPGVVGSQVPVRYEPSDMGVAWAYVAGQWVSCIANRYQEVHGRSEREWDIAVTEWKHDMRVLGKEKMRVDGLRLAKFLAENEAREAILAQRMRDLEARGIEEGRMPPGVPPVREASKAAVAAPTRASFTLNLADLPTFEEDGDA